MLFCVIFIFIYISMLPFSCQLPYICCVATNGHENMKHELAKIFKNDHIFSGLSGSSILNFIPYYI